jgi:peroxiredoxin
MEYFDMYQRKETAAQRAIRISGPRVAPVNPLRVKVIGFTTDSLAKAKNTIKSLNRNGLTVLASASGKFIKVIALKKRGKRLCVK